MDTEVEKQTDGAATCAAPRQVMVLDEVPSVSKKQTKTNREQSDPFHVDSSKIQAVPASQQESELQDLGLTVFNQDEFEEGIMAQVDEAMAKEEEERLKRILEKEKKAVDDDLRTCQQELSQINKVLSMIRQRGSGESNKQLEAVLRQKENKMNQLKKLLAKERKLKGGDGEKKGPEGKSDPDDISSIEEALGISGSSGETEQQRMIRLGMMTPFGTLMHQQSQQQSPKSQHTSQKGPASKPSQRTVVTDQMSDFEKYLLDQGKKSTRKQPVKRKLPPKANSVSDSDSHTAKKSDSVKLKKIKSESDLKRKKSKMKKEKESDSGESGEFDGSGGHLYSKKGSANLFDVNDKRVYRPDETDFSQPRFSRRRKSNYPQLEHNFTEDPDLDFGDEEVNRDGSEDEYVPDDDELRDSWMNEDAEYPGSVVKRKGRKRKAKTGEDGDDDAAVEDPIYNGGVGISLESIKESFGVAKKKRESYGSLNRCRDDGNEAYYIRRIKKYKKEELQRQHAATRGEEGSESDDGSDMDFDGGLCVPGRIWKKLYRYQKTGVKWLWELHCQKVGGIVGDEMGLGKTIQIIAFLSSLRHSNLKDPGSSFRGLGPSIIVCPTTVMHQWVKEFHKWSPLFRVAILHGTGSFNTSEEALIDNINHSRGILVTSYSSLTLRQDLLLQYPWHYIILDEGHKIRNPDAQVTVAVKQFRTCHRLILSGSPVQNNLKELWSLFDFVFPGKLGTLPDFMTHFSVPIVQGGYANATQVQVQTAYKCACVVRDTINPYMLRRMKADVKTCLDLPSKNEQVLFCRLTEEQKDVYQEYLASKECTMILSGKFMVFPGLITLRKVCNHPDISTGGPQNYLRENEYSPDDESMQYGFWRRSGKLIVVESLLKLWKKQGHRVLLFTQSQQMLEILEKFTEQQGYTYLRMDGGTSISARQPLIDKFNNDTNYFVFLLTTRVGGLGVNLTGANRVVIYDPDWNPSTDMQARERAWRIGQQKQVTVYRLLTTGTIEEKIYHRQIFKQFLTNRVLKDPKQRRFFKSNDLYELFSLTCDDGHGTETSAIFAGTGSDVKVKRNLKDKYKVKVSGETKRNIFDEMKERGESQITESDEELEAGSDAADEKQKRLKELAKKLGHRKVFPPKSAEKSPEKNGRSASDMNADAVEDQFAVSSKLTSFPAEEVPSTSKDFVKDISQGISVHNSKGISVHKSKGSKHKHKKKKKKRKKKDADMEGEKICHLDKHSKFQPGDQDVDGKEEAAAQDDFVLSQLLKKSGVHSAMQHDKIMMSSDPDYALVEAEAQRVASSAAKALKKSRSLCNKASAGVPTWTGQSGAIIGNKPRFGQKKKTFIIDPDASQALPSKKSSTNGSAPTPKDDNKHFDGSLAGNRTNLTASKSKTETLSSADLLERMRARNNMTADQAPQSDNSDSEAAEVAPPTITLNSEEKELMEDIRNFISFQARVDGQASTQELLAKFGQRLPPNMAAKFKAMLKQLCSLQKIDGVGTWRLRKDFR